ncbi:MAG TPA: TIGR03118 family protein [Terriglobia bacterium]|nr:TIGR03118 family protein [Terriglobia bacterium]
MRHLFREPSILLALVIAFLLTLFPQPVSAQYTVSNLVSNDSAFSPLNIDPNLVNGWGLASFPNGPWWVSNQNSSTSTLYDGDGTIVPLVVQIPCVASGTVTVPCPFPGEGLLFEPNNGMFNFFGPTGVVANPYASAFIIPGTSSSAQFIFATLDGLIVGWNSSVNATQGVVIVNRNSVGASYNGLALSGPPSDPHLYATNTVTGGEVDVFDRHFNLVNSFPADSNVPVNFAPYGVDTIGNKLYVTYFSFVGSAGILDVCDLATSFTNPKCRRLFASLGSSPVLASPFGMVRAPDNFGPLSNKLLVGNVDDGLIHAFESDTGRLIGTLRLTDGSDFSVPGLWDLGFGSGNASNGATNQLFFSSGPCPPLSGTCPVQLYGDGLFGVIAPAGNDAPGAGR